MALALKVSICFSNTLTRLLQNYAVKSLFFKESLSTYFLSIPQESIILQAKTFVNINHKMLFETKSI